MNDIAGITIREERAGDIEAVRAINSAAFGGDDEAHLVDALREAGALLLSLVAERDGKVIGHIAFSAASLDEAPEIDVVGLAPIAVLPGYQRQGVGSAMIQAGLERLRKAGYELVMVLGHPAYYPRFGFEPASRFGVRWTQPVPDEAFMLLELQPGVLAGVHGVLRYHPFIEAMSC